ncbi:MAG: UDP-N-acetylmuramoyl-L-alanyl-D-glutamate--2,6-diaminopimelate ligase [Ruminococcaceae bacterium]|nr:UDP-N-acetylmuramoyl-L-alanyl-D-glutamate--2,6-diaminopimelate ligase [Oscillospiraceae bacterium]
MKLSDILCDIEFTADNYIPDVEISNICYDSRKAKAGDAFICIKGYQSDGHKYAKSAYDSGVRVFVVEKVLDLPKDATVIYVNNSRIALAKASAAFFSYPAEKLCTVAITGTKGKTSVSFMLKSIFEKAGIKTGVIGTTGIYYDDVAIKTENSTPESYEIHRHFAAMAEKGCNAVVIEATSQGFMLNRTAGITFDYGVYTNLSPDHIGGNEHKDFDEYKTCKKMLFSQCKLGIANIDSAYFEEMTADAKCTVKTYGVENKADICGSNLVFSCRGKQLCTTFDYAYEGKTFTVDLNIPGKFSVHNALAAISVAKELNISEKNIADALSETFVKGRMETVPISGGKTVIIDYAHNELSVQSLFDTMRLYSPEKLTVVFGCGGNRSKLRRYSMGEIIGKNADLSVITSDNPRFERVDDIIEDILVGTKRTDGKYIVIKDRKEAIEYAVKNAIPGEVVLIIGKGHQLYEEIEGVKHPFDEREIVKNIAI